MGSESWQLYLLITFYVTLFFLVENKPAVTGKPGADQLGYTETKCGDVEKGRRTETEGKGKGTANQRDISGPPTAGS